MMPSVKSQCQCDEASHLTSEILSICCHPAGSRWQEPATPQVRFECGQAPRWARSLLLKLECACGAPGDFVPITCVRGGRGSLRFQHPLAGGGEADAAVGGQGPGDPRGSHSRDRCLRASLERRHSLPLTIRSRMTQDGSRGCGGRRAHLVPESQVHPHSVRICRVQMAKGQGSFPPSTDT